MMRKRNFIIAITAAVALTAASATGVFARGGGGGGHGGMGGGHASMGGGHAIGGGGWGGHAVGMGFASRAAVGHVGTVGVAGSRAWGWHGNHVAFHNRFAFRHHRFHNRFFFAAAAFPYGYDDGCLVRVWTPVGWRWRNVCY